MDRLYQGLFFILIIFFIVQIGLVVSFFLFMIIYWSIALNHYFNEIKFHDSDEPMESH